MTFLEIFDCYPHEAVIDSDRDHDVAYTGACASKMAIQ
jgi:hypothetical protein